jgi:hypothetical protein
MPREQLLASPIGKSTSRSSFLFVSALVAAGVVTASAGDAQELGPLCPPEGFDICFPNLDAGAPNAACDASEENASDITACLGSVCGGVKLEPEPGFFAYCCAGGGSKRYDDFCVFVVQDACPKIADHCEDRCPPLELLLGTVSLAPPSEACLEDYPPFIAAVCDADPFCCSTSWDAICAGKAIELGGG